MTTYRIPVDCLPFALGVSAKTIRRWIADQLLDVAPDRTVDDMAAQHLRDTMRQRQQETRFKRLT